MSTFQWKEDGIRMRAECCGFKFVYVEDDMRRWYVNEGLNDYSMAWGITRSLLDAEREIIEWFEKRSAPFAYIANQIRKSRPEAHPVSDDQARFEQICEELRTQQAYGTKRDWLLFAAQTDQVQLRCVFRAIPSSNSDGIPSGIPMGLRAGFRSQSVQFLNQIGKVSGIDRKGGRNEIGMMGTVLSAG